MDDGCISTVDRARKSLNNNALRMAYIDICAEYFIKQC